MDQPFVNLIRVLILGMMFAAALKMYPHMSELKPMLHLSSEMRGLHRSAVCGQYIYKEVGCKIMTIPWRQSVDESHLPCNLNS